MTIELDDPRLTAYALGELEDGDRTAVESFLAESAEARAAVEEVRRTGERLEAELSAEPMMTMSGYRREVIEAHLLAGKLRRWLPRAAAAAVVLAVAGFGFHVAQSGVSRRADIGTTALGHSGQTVSEEIVPVADRLQSIDAKSELRRILPSFRAQGETVETVLKKLSQRAGIKFVVNWEALERVGITRESQITLYLCNYSVSDILEMMLRDLGYADEPLGIVAANSEIHISTADDLNSSPYALAYGRDDIIEIPGQGGRMMSLKTVDRPTSASRSGSGSNDKLALSYGYANLGVASDLEIDAHSTSLSKKETEIHGLDKLWFDLRQNNSTPKEFSATPSEAGNDESLNRVYSQHYAETLPVPDVLRQTFVAKLSALSPEEHKMLIEELSSQRIDRPAAKAGGRIKRSKDVERRPDDDPWWNLPREGHPPMPENTGEAYAALADNPFLPVLQNPLSTFSIDVDTGSYANVRRMLTTGRLPPPNAVRIEEMLNYFAYNYAPPAGEHPFAVHTEVAACPWKPEHRLVRIGLKGRVIPQEQRPTCNLVFLIDVSGSMDEPNKLPLVKQGLTMMTGQLGPEDRVAIVVYAGESGVALESTPATNKGVILEAIDRLKPGGSTNGGAGIEEAYAIATSHYLRNGVNRVVLCTDGDFNVGVTERGELVKLIEERAKSGVFLSVLGFGMGNLKDATLEQLADKGNGHYAYIDTFREAKKVLVDEISGTLVTIAKDVKIQIEFNPAQAAAYRLIGYENRLLAARDFNDDTKDAGEIGAGHTVTALYEVVPAALSLAGVDPLLYQKPKATTRENDGERGDELMSVRLRYKQPDGDQSTLIEVPLKASDIAFADASGDLRFAAAVASFGMILRNSPHRGDVTFDAVIETSVSALEGDPDGQRSEFVDLVRKAKMLAGIR